MVRRADKNYDLLKNFLDFLRNEEYTLMGNSVFRDSSRWGKLPPRKGDKVSININIQGSVPSDKREDILINTFLEDLRSS
jgi:hypothetical protein|tara:strand:+ start:33 stop:272 length:240 start_codon:yes stop_codon:yes gene_type:complete